MLALRPTRELAMQAAAEVEEFARYKKGVKVAAVFGGASMEKQIFQLKKGANFVIGTPGRVMDHLRRRTLRLGSLQMVILDEADEMLNMGFREDIETILAQAPVERQTVLFSATMPQPILDITREYQQDPVMVAIGNERSRTAENIEQFYFDCPMGRKMDVPQPAARQVRSQALGGVLQHQEDGGRTLRVSHQCRLPGCGHPWRYAPVGPVPR